MIGKPEEVGGEVEYSYRKCPESRRLVCSCGRAVFNVYQPTDYETFMKCINCDKEWSIHWG